MRGRGGAACVQAVDLNTRKSVDSRSTVAAFVDSDEDVEPVRAVAAVNIGYHDDDDDGFGPTDGVLDQPDNYIPAPFDGQPPEESLDARVSAACQSARR